MVTIRNIGEALLSHIENNDKTPIKNINDLIQKHKISLDDIDNANMYKKELYKKNYEIPRNENKMKYELYLKERAELVKILENDKNSQAKLLNVLNFKRPELAEIEDIYSYQNIKLNSDKVVKNTDKVIKDVKIGKDIIVEKPKKAIKEKECPQGKVLNPLTGRCITEKAVKKIVAKPVAEAKPSTEVAKPSVVEAKPVAEAKPSAEVAKPSVVKKAIKEKECPPGKILNPITNRCITEKAVKKIVAEPAVKVAEPAVKVAKPAVEVAKPVVEVAKPAVEVAEPTAKKAIKEKECPPGKILNPKTGRCINIPKK
jgi:hypothetical protein